jgi:phenylacetate-CoA ligase
MKSLYKKFVHFESPKDINKRLFELKNKDSLYWLKLGEKNVLRLANFVLNSTPAYKKFLLDSGLNYKKISKIEDFLNLPSINKDNYLRKYNYLDLFPYRDITITSTVSATSGSTGEPFYFPRGQNLDDQYKYVTEIFLKNQWEIDDLKTLCIICFGLGLWIGGIYTNKAWDELTKKGYKLTVAPVGTNKELILKTFKVLAPFYDQIILVGYPPFIKDLADEGILNNIEWKKHKIRILNAAESFSEKFREYFANKFGLKNIINDNINIYGSVELGAMGHETAFSNLIRRIALEKDKTFRAIFQEANRIPTLAQYHPYIIWFEEKDGLILASGYGNSIPLLRYSFPDKGGVIYFDDMVKRLKSCGIDIFKEAEKAGIKDKILKLPFVYVYERSDFAVSLVGINIYPEYIKNAIIKKELQKYFTGKFSMIVNYDKKMNQKLVVHIELKKLIKPNKKIEKIAQKEITHSLLKNSTEYNHLYSSGSLEYKKQLEPEIVLHFYEDPNYFRPGIKQKWSIKNN